MLAWVALHSMPRIAVDHLDRPLDVTFGHFPWTCHCFCDGHVVVTSIAVAAIEPVNDALSASIWHVMNLGTHNYAVAMNVFHCVRYGLELFHRCCDDDGSSHCDADYCWLLGSWATLPHYHELELQVARSAHSTFERLAERPMKSLMLLIEPDEIKYGIWY